MNNRNPVYEAYLKGHISVADIVAETQCQHLWEAGWRWGPLGARFYWQRLHGDIIVAVSDFHAAWAWERQQSLNRAGSRT